MGSFIDIKGKRFGRLVVLSRSHKSAPGMYFWRCLCDCGRKTVVRGSSLRHRNTISCGCRKRTVLPESTTTHGLSNTRVYQTWQRMKTRCTNKNSPDYRDYGGRGIRLSLRWSGKSGLLNFVRDMGHPKPGMTIDRKNVNGPYSKANCRWATQHEQQRNKRNTRHISWLGKKRCLSDWCALLGWHTSRLHKRLERMTLNRAMAPFKKFT